MDKIYEHSNDLHVRGTYIYVQDSDVYAYADSEFVNKINAEVLKDLFLKGAVVVDNDINYNPISYAVSEGVGTITYVKADTTTATTAVLATIKSEEHVTVGSEPEESP